MSDFNWCHGPECHEKRTVDRIRGTKGNKVLRTRKISLSEHMQNNPDASWNFFCSTSCERDFWYKYGNQIRAIAPRTEPLETPIEDPKKTVVTSHWNPNHTWTETTITKVDTTG